MKYKVEATFVSSGTYTVDARNAEEARDIIERFYKGTEQDMRSVLSKKKELWDFNFYFDEISNKAVCCE